jgi:hypothetical protein
VLAKLIGTSVEKVQFGLVALLSALLIVAKAAGLGFAGLLWSVKSVDKGSRETVSRYTDVETVAQLPSERVSALKPNKIETVTEQPIKTI